LQTIWRIINAEAQGISGTSLPTLDDSTLERVQWVVEEGKKRREQARLKSPTGP
jgi:hypothetical protein